MTQEDIKKELETAINKFNNRGITLNEIPEDLDTEGLGDVLESVLTSMGITEERFKEWFNLKECGCGRRKKWLNKLMNWKKK